jgi:hypothetical protein
VWTNTPLLSRRARDLCRRDRPPPRIDRPEATAVSKNRDDEPVREVSGGIETHQPPLLDAGVLSDLLAGSGLSAVLPVDREAFARTHLYDVLAASTAITGLARGEGRGVDLVAVRAWLAALAG